MMDAKSRKHATRIEPLRRRRLLKDVTGIIPLLNDVTPGTFDLSAKSESSTWRCARGRLTVRVVEFGQPVGGSRVAAREQRDGVVAHGKHRTQVVLLRFAEDRIGAARDLRSQVREELTGGLARGFILAAPSVNRGARQSVLQRTDA